MLHCTVKFCNPSENPCKKSVLVSELSIAPKILIQHHRFSQKDSCSLEITLLECTRCKRVCGICLSLLGGDIPAAPRQQD
jgi:hypothetical protein